MCMICQLFKYCKMSMESCDIITCTCIVNVLLYLLFCLPQVPDEKFLVLINDLLASGEIPGLFADDELDNIIAGLRNECKSAGIQDTKENVWKFFIDRVRRQLKVIILHVQIQ